MKVLVIFALALASASAFTVIYEKPLRPMDLAIDAKEADANEIVGRITNGNTASAGQFPYQVGLSLKRSTGSYWCGGSLISQTWVLTAAHCTDGVDSAIVYLGSTTRTVAKVSYSVSKSAIQQHSGYNSNTLANDVSLIQIPTVAYTSEIQPISLPASANSYSTYAGDNAIASGWGRTTDTGSVASSLNWAQLQVITNSVCAATYGTTTVTSNTICVSTPSGTSTCQGDSGGPLVLQGTNTLIGVTSFVASAGCQSGRPAGFARVTSFLPWIKERTGL